MIAKCGPIVIHHWAHYGADPCHAYAPETEWHRRWKARMHDAGARIEVICRANGRCHIADVVSPAGRILELAGTYHTADAIRDRERFYGPKLFWLYNTAPFWDRIEFWDRHGERCFRFKQPPKTMLLHRRRSVHWDYGEIDRIDRFWTWRDRTYGAVAYTGTIGEFVSGLLDASS